MRLIRGGELEHVQMVRVARTETMELGERVDGLIWAYLGSIRTQAGDAYSPHEAWRDAALLGEFTREVDRGFGVICDIRPLLGGMELGVLDVPPVADMAHMAFVIDNGRLRMLADAYRGRAKGVAEVEVFETVAEAASWLLDKQKDRAQTA